MRLPEPEKPDPVKVDWAVDDGPDCKDCRYARERVYGGSYECKKYPSSTCLMPTNLVRKANKPTGVKGYGECGPEGRGFERREFDPSEYDFNNNPPEPMAWR